MIKMVPRAIAVLLIGFVSAVIGLILGSIIGGNLAAFGYIFVFNGQRGYETGGQLGFIFGALIGLIGSYAILFGRRTRR